MLPLITAPENRDAGSGELKEKRGWRDLMIGGGDDSHLPKVLGPAELAFDKNRLRFNIRRVLPSAWTSSGFSITYIAVSINGKQRLDLFWKHDSVIGRSLLN